MNILNTMNILCAGDKSPVQRGFFKNSESNLLPALRFLRFRNDRILPYNNIYINSNLNPLRKFTSNSRSTEFKDILPWNIFQMITKTIAICTRILISYAMKQGIPF